MPFCCVKSCLSSSGSLSSLNGVDQRNAASTSNASRASNASNASNASRASNASNGPSALNGSSISSCCQSPENIETNEVKFLSEAPKGRIPQFPLELGGFDFSVSAPLVQATTEDGIYDNVPSPPDPAPVIVIGVDNIELYGEEKKVCLNFMRKNLSLKAATTDEKEGSSESSLKTRVQKESAFPFKSGARSLPVFETQAPLLPPKQKNYSSKSY